MLITLPAVLLALAALASLIALPSLLVARARLGDQVREETVETLASLHDEPRYLQMS